MADSKAAKRLACEKPAKRLANEKNRQARKEERDWKWQNSMLAHSFACAQCGADGVRSQYAPDWYKTYLSESFTDEPVLCARCWLDHAHDNFAEQRLVVLREERPTETKFQHLDAIEAEWTVLSDKEHASYAKPRVPPEDRMLVIEPKDLIPVRTAPREEIHKVFTQDEIDCLSTGTATEETRQRALDWFKNLPACQDDEFVTPTSGVFIIY
jgi:hypothetical protein